MRYTPQCHVFYDRFGMLFWCMFQPLSHYNTLIAINKPSANLKLIDHTVSESCSALTIILFPLANTIVFCKRLCLPNFMISSIRYQLFINTQHVCAITVIHLARRFKFSNRLRSASQPLYKFLLFTAVPWAAPASVKSLWAIIDQNSVVNTCIKTKAVTIHLLDSNVG